MRIHSNGRPGGGRWHRLVLGPVGWSCQALAFFWGRNVFPSRALAAPLPGLRNGVPRPLAGRAQPTSDYSRRVVAYINGNIPITRQDLGEYLIARNGAEKLELLVNKRIIDMYCKQKRIEVTAAEVDADLAEDLKGLGVANVKDFVDQVLKHHNMNLYEWKEDVIRPKLLMTKLCRDRVHVTEQDLQDAFEAHFGEKVDCRIILFPRGQENAGHGCPGQGPRQRGGIQPPGPAAGQPDLAGQAAADPADRPAHHRQ